MHSTILHIADSLEEEKMTEFTLECNQVSPYCDYIGDEFSQKEIEEWLSYNNLPTDMFEVSNEKNGIIKLTYKQYPEEWFENWYNDFHKLANKITIDDFKNDSLDLFRLAEIIKYKNLETKVYTEYKGCISFCEWVIYASKKPIGTEFYLLTAFDYHY